MMTKKDFIALADALRAEYHANNELLRDEKLSHEMCRVADEATQRAIYAVADVCEAQNPQFNRQRWLEYIAGKCGQSGGKI